MFVGCPALPSQGWEWCGPHEMPPWQRCVVGHRSSYCGLRRQQSVISGVLRGLPRFIVSQTPKPPTSTKSPLSSVSKRTRRPRGFVEDGRHQCRQCLARGWGQELEFRWATPWPLPRRRVSSAEAAPPVLPAASCLEDVCDLGVWATNTEERWRSTAFEEEDEGDKTKTQGKLVCPKTCKRAAVQVSPEAGGDEMLKKSVGSSVVLIVDSNSR